MFYLDMIVGSSIVQIKCRFHSD